MFGEICPRSDPDIANMRYYNVPGPSKVEIYFNFPISNPHRQLCKYGPHLLVPDLKCRFQVFVTSVREQNDTSPQLGYNTLNSPIEACFQQKHAPISFLMSSSPLIEARPFQVCEMADMKRKTLKNDQSISRKTCHSTSYTLTLTIQPTWWWQFNTSCKMKDFKDSLFL